MSAPHSTFPVLQRPAMQAGMGAKAPRTMTISGSVGV